MISLIVVKAILKKLKEEHIKRKRHMDMLIQCNCHIHNIRIFGETL